VSMTQAEDGVVLICRNGTRPASDDEWLRLEDHGGMSGVAGLINELVRAAGGEAEFRFSEMTLCGMRLLFPTQM